MNKHTPGDWKFDPVRNASGFCVVDSLKRVIANCTFKSRSREEAEANARLITAAPELLVILKVIRNGGNPTRQTIDAIIAKAEGK